MTTHYGGSYIHVYLCPNHPDERWDVQIMSDEKPLVCLACEIKRLRKENEELKEDLKAAIWCGDDRVR
jgi:hypothetical protein